jgi:hypothetical protein
MVAHQGTKGCKVIIIRDSMPVQISRSHNPHDLERFLSKRCGRVSLLPLLSISQSSLSCPSTAVAAARKDHRHQLLLLLLKVLLRPYLLLLTVLAASVNAHYQKRKRKQSKNPQQKLTNSRE